MMFSPLTIGLMLHVYVYSICEPIKNRGAPAVQDSLAQLRDLGLIELADGRNSGFQATPKGRSWVEMICTTPPPKEAFVDPRTGEMI